jgi:signal transduction histidine kinase
MSQFEVYFKLGIAHILDLEGFDHILFIVALCAIYLGRDWRKIIILVTAFTIGHSITLALATLNIIRDNGEGISAENLPKIFDPFFTSKDVGEGMGLGLSICYRIMQQHRGGIDVRSEPGQYCEFKLCFPRASGNAVDFMQA